MLENVGLELIGYLSGNGNTGGAHVTEVLQEIQDAGDEQIERIEAAEENMAPVFSVSTAYSAGDYVLRDGVMYRFTADHAAGTWTGSDAVAVKAGTELTHLKQDISELESQINKYDDLCRIIKITNTGTTLGDIASILNTVNTVGDHVFFDMSALGVMMYLCTIYIDTTENVYKVFDLVSGRYAEGVYSANTLLTMATAQANSLAVQSQIDALQDEIDELGGKSVINNWSTLGDLIASGQSTSVIQPGYTTDINWIKSVLGTTTSGLTVTCTDMDAFINGVGEAEESEYLIVFDGTNWTYGGESISLELFGLSVSGTPQAGEVMDIKTTVNAISYTFVGYDDFISVDANVPHNWCLEQTYAPDTKAYNTYESLFCIQAGKSVPAGKYYLPMYSYYSGKTFNVCFELSAAIGGDTKIQMQSTGYQNGAYADASGASISNVYKPNQLKPVLFGTTTAAGANISTTLLSTSDATAGGYSLLTNLNVDANDPVVVVGDFDRSALGNNCWPMCNMHEWLADDTADDNYVPTYDNNIASAYNRNRGFLWGIDPRVKELIQYANIYWTSGYGNHDLESFQPATGTAPASDAPTYYVRSGTPGNRTFTPASPQPSAGASVEGMFVLLTSFTNGKTYVSEDRVFLLSMKEMSFDIQTNEGNATDLYSEYTNNTLTNSAVADRAKYNKAGGTLNNYRWSRSGYSGHAYRSRLVTSTGSYSSHYAYTGFFFAPAFIIGKSV